VADIRLYVDAVLQAQQTVGAPGVGSLANSVFLEVGWQPGTTDEPVALDELEIFNVALAPSDVGAIFNAGSGGKCKCTTGGQSVDLTVAASGALFGGGFSVPAVVSGPLSVNYAVQGCGGHEMFVILRAPARRRHSELSVLQRRPGHVPAPAQPAVVHHALRDGRAGHHRRQPHPVQRDPACGNL